MTVTKPIYRRGERYYVELDLMEVKVPFRYRKAEVIMGFKTIWEFREGHRCLVDIRDGQDGVVQVLREIREIP